MTTDRDLDRRLATWLDERSVQAPPADLLARALIRVEAGAQRPAWRFVGLGRLAPRSMSPSFLPLWAILVLTTLLAIAVLVVGSQLLKTEITAISSTQPSAEATIAPIASPIPTFAATEAPGFTPAPGMFANVGNVFAESDTVAWVTTEGALLRTDDAAATWRGAGPPGWAFDGATVVVDAGTVFYGLGGTRPTLGATHDGGRTWATIEVDAGADVGTPIFSFASATLGFATFVDPALFNAKAGTGLIVFATTDGGSTWTGPMRGTQPHMDASSNKVYAANGPFLVQSAGKADNSPFENWFYLSSNGGVSYTRYTFPVSKISPRNAMKMVGAILQEPNGRLLIQFSATPGGPGTYPNAIYESTDDPAAWRLLYTEPGGDWNVQFLSPTTWIMPAGAPSEVRTTTDAGVSWRAVTPSMSLYWAGGKPFGSLQTGWTTIECHWLPQHSPCGANNRAEYLFVTRDGGATWTEVGS